MSPPPADTPERRPPPDCEQAIEAGRDLLKTLFPLPPPRSKRRRRPAKAGQRLLGALAVAALAGGLWWLDPVYRQEHYATAVGERREVLLADGSSLTLDTASRVDIAWGLRSRQATLAAGRALFAVAPASYRPFEVAAGDSRVRVVGTVFEVRRDEHQVAVSVIEGKVRVGLRQAPEALLLTRGERVINRGGELGPVQAGDTEAAAWAAGQLVFERTPLREALAELQRYREQPIRLHGEAVGGLEISGVFDTARSEQLLNQLPAILPLRVIRLADGSVEIVAR